MNPLDVLTTDGETPTTPPTYGRNRRGPARLGIPVGGVGPTRSRCLDKLRRHPAIAVLIDAETGSGGSAI